MKPAAPLTGTITMPGDKSISHRALLLAALAPGTARITGINFGADVVSTARCLTALGATCRVDPDKGYVEVEGCGVGKLHEPAGVLDAGNSGTTLRCLLGICSSIPGVSVLTGDESLRRRPMLRVVSPLRQMGARIDGRDHGNLAPLTVRGGELEGIDIELQVASAQVKTALLLAGLGASGTTRITQPGVTRDHTERMLSAHGIDLSRDREAVEVSGGQALGQIDRWVPGDVSGAMFFVVAAAVVPRSDLTIERVGLNPTRIAALEVLRSMGADLEWDVEDEAGGEPYGRLQVRASELQGITIPADLVAQVIDELPALAIAGAHAQGTTSVTGAGELRVKESDRITTICTGLTTLGAKVEERADGFSIAGPAPLHGGAVDSHGDHRIAMAFAIAGLTTRSKVTIKGWSSVDTSFPGFLDVLASAQAKKKR